MVAAVYFVSETLSGWFAESGMQRIVALVALVTAGVLAYAVAIFALKALTLAEIKGFIRSKA